MFTNNPERSTAEMAENTFEMVILKWYIEIVIFAIFGPSPLKAERAKLAGNWEFNLELKFRSMDTTKWIIFPIYTLNL